MKSKKLSLKVLLDDDSEENLKQRLLDNGYMVLPEKCTGFVCGNCTWADNGFCNHKSIQTEINVESGCCSHFYPRNEEPKFGKQV